MQMCAPEWNQEDKVKDGVNCVAVLQHNSTGRKITVCSL